MSHPQPPHGGVIATALTLPTLGSLLALILLPGLFGYGAVFCLIGIGAGASSLLLPRGGRQLAQGIAALAVLAGVVVIIAGAVR